MKQFIIIGAVLGLVGCHGPTYDQELWVKVNRKCHDDNVHWMGVGQRVLFCEDMAYKAVGRPEKSPLNK